ncbi:MAG: hypothetical protein Q4E89_07755 [Eubacteriales bacterium]|nr:hypothetical protein [Eubacteriales bacterium]
MKRKPFITKCAAVLLAMCMLIGDTSLIFAAEGMAEEDMFTQSDAAYQDFMLPVEEVTEESEGSGMENEIFQETEGFEAENGEAEVPLEEIPGEHDSFVDETPDISGDAQEDDSQEPGTQEEEELLLEQDIFSDDPYEGGDEPEEVEEDIFGQAMTDSPEAQGKVDLANLSYTFTTLDGAAVNTTAAEKPKLLIFFQTECWNCKAVLQMLRSAEEDLSGMELLAVEISEKTSGEIREFAGSYGP